MADSAGCPTQLTSELKLDQWNLISFSTMSCPIFPTPPDLVKFRVLSRLPHPLVGVISWVEFVGGALWW